MNADEGHAMSELEQQWLENKNLKGDKNVSKSNKKSIKVKALRVGAKRFGQDLRKPNHSPINQR